MRMRKGQRHEKQSTKGSLQIFEEAQGNQVHCFFCLQVSVESKSKVCVSSPFKSYFQRLKKKIKKS